MTTGGWAGPRAWAADPAAARRRAGLYHSRSRPGMIRAILARLDAQAPDWSAAARLAGSLERFALRQARLQGQADVRDVRII